MPTSETRCIMDEVKDGCAVVGPKHIREFGSGATRDAVEGKLDYDGFNHPLVEESFAKYMESHRVQRDGQVRASDNWTKGMPRSVYLKSLVRHVHAVRMIMRGYHMIDERDGHPVTLEESLCACRFNVNGLLLEEMLGREIDA